MTRYGLRERVVRVTEMTLRQEARGEGREYTSILYS